MYKFLSLGCGEGRKKSSDATYEYCRFCKHGKRRGEVVNSLDSHGKNMVNKRRDTKKNSRVHRVKRRHTARDQTLSRCTHSRIRGEGQGDVITIREHFARIEVFSFKNYNFFSHYRIFVRTSRTNCRDSPLENESKHDPVRTIFDYTKFQVFRTFFCIA